MPKKFRIGLDFDDVLIGTADHTAKLHNSIYGTNVTRDDWYDQGILADWKVRDLEEIVSRVVEIHELVEFLEVEPIQGAYEVLKKLKAAGHELIVVTGRPEELRASTAAILKKYYGDVIDSDDLYFTNHFSYQRARVHKGDVAKELKLTHFVDDVVEHTNSVAAAGIRTILFSDNYSWNQTEPDAGVTRLNSWKEIGAFFDDEQRA